jgi:hypothetical protein
MPASAPHPAPARAHLSAGGGARDRARSVGAAAQDALLPLAWLAPDRPHVRTAQGQPALRAAGGGEVDFAKQWFQPAAACIRRPRVEHVRLTRALLDLSLEARPRPASAWIRRDPCPCRRRARRATAVELQLLDHHAGADRGEREYDLNADGAGEPAKWNPLSRSHRRMGVGAPAWSAMCFAIPSRLSLAVHAIRCQQGLA